jgi:hypothetical protein
MPTSFRLWNVFFAHPPVLTLQGVISSSLAMPTSFSAWQKSLAHQNFFYKITGNQISLYLAKYTVLYSVMADIFKMNFLKV